MSFEPLCITRWPVSLYQNYHYLANSHLVEHKWTSKFDLLWPNSALLINWSFDWFFCIYVSIYLFFGFYKILTNAWPTQPSVMSTRIAVTLRDRIIAPVIEDIAEMERRVLVTMFTYWFIYFWYSLQGNPKV